MKINLLIAAMFTLPAFAATEPSSIIFACKSKVAGDTTVQIYGNITETGLTDVTFININAWDPDVKPTVRKKETWKPDANYKPTKKYENYQRYQIQDNTPDQPEIQLIIPNKMTVYALAAAKAKKNKDDLVQGDFDGILRMREDYHDDVGGQEYLECGTGWLNF